jgi:hypothetical protein
MADALAAWRAAAAASGGGRGAGRVGGKGEGKNKSKGVLGRLSRIERVLLAHERSLHALEDRCSFAIFLKTPAVQQPIEYFRDQWRTADKQRREAPPAEGQPQAQIPLGTQHSVVHASIFAAFKTRVPADNHARQACEMLAGMVAKDVEAAVFRLRPRHDKPKDGRTWVWQLMVSERCSAEYLGALDKLSAWRSDDIGVGKQHSQDGPLT